MIKLILYQITMRRQLKVGSLPDKYSCTNLMRVHQFLFTSYITFKFIFFFGQKNQTARDQQLLEFPKLRNMEKLMFKHQDNIIY